MEANETTNKLLCVACLCVGRSLKNLTEEKCRGFYLKALSEIPLFTSPALNLAVCFECEALLKKAVAFKEQVKDSYRILQTYTNESLIEFLLTDVTRPPRLKVHCQHFIDVAPTANTHVKNEVKDEYGSVKIEELSGDKRNNQSELFTSLKTENIDSDSPTLQELSQKKNMVKKKWKTKSSKVAKNRKVKKSNTKHQHSQNLTNGSPKILEVNINEESNDSNHIEHDDWCPDSVSEEKSAVVQIKKIQRGVNKEKRLKHAKKDYNYKKTKTDGRIKSIQLTDKEIMKERALDSEKDGYICSEFKCESCVKTFVSIECLVEHNKAMHDQSLGEFVCPTCQCVFSSQELLNAHQRGHIRRYECTVCGNRSLDQSTARQHLRTAHRILKQYTCRLCNQISFSLDRHRYHMECHKSRVQCPECDKTFSHRAGLMNHRLVVHEFQNKFPCTLCDKVFQWKNSLKRHLEKHDSKNTTEDSGAFCSPCGIAFAYVCSYKRHLRNSLKHVTHDQLKYICDHCSRRFADKTKLRNHIEEKHLHKTYQCTICHKPTKNRAHLEQHVRNVHIGRPNNKMCHHCGKGFPTKVQLESHMRTHTGERPFICELCPTTFTQQSNLYKHNRQVHQNIKTKRYPPHKKRKQEENPEQTRHHQATGDYRHNAQTHYVDTRFV